MAFSSAATPDTPITLKISFHGATRRIKLPLRDLGASTLEDKLRNFLEIPTGTKAVFERYSDSAGAYVVLDPTNMSVYKQLFRAAKAKQKLKLRVAVPTEEESTTGPKPVTVEDEPESSEEKVEVASPDITVPSKPMPTPSASQDTIVAPQVADEFPGFIKNWRERGMPKIHLRRDENGVEVIDFLTNASPSDPMVTLAPLPGQPASSAEPTQYRFSQTASTLSFADMIRSAREAIPPASLEKLEQLEEQEQEKKEERSIPKCPAFVSRVGRPFTVCCNSCDRAVPDAHFHCSTCDDGDFDLCQDCVNKGISCYNDQHWLIKRTVKDGQLSYSTTHVAPKSTRSLNISKVPAPQPTIRLPIRPAERIRTSASTTPTFTARTCNSCVQEFPEKEFLHCESCEDFDLCKSCFGKDQHGHHPKHAFVPAVQGTIFESSITARLSAGRNTPHNAICDGCDGYIRGVRHKCLECPDWDYCSDCVQNAGFIHPNHRFAPIYERLSDPAAFSVSRPVHVGICCDGPLCTSARSGSKYIVGDRYKCAVCHDTDFCANCEASPANTHNKTHPLIKFKTPVRHVSVSTTGEHQNGQRLPHMGDRIVAATQRTSSRSTETIPSPSENISLNPVQTVVDVEPSEAQVPAESVKLEEVATPEPEKIVPSAEEREPELVAVFQHDTVEDGTVMPPNHTFEQTWVLRNEGEVAWPAGCSVKFVGGDYMGAIDPSHPAGIHELISASESTVCYNQLQPGQEFPFTVLMRTPEREGKVISYWRLTSPDGIKFGHKLWCDVAVEAASIKVKEEQKEESLLDSTVPELARSHMIIPKLDHESPASSVHVPSTESDVDAVTETETVAPSAAEEDYEDCAEDDEWAQESDDGFMTDEEYDILDASDEEYLFEQQKLVSKQ